MRASLRCSVAFCRSSFLITRRHAGGGENHDRRDVRLENLQARIDPAFVGDDHAQGLGRLAAGNSRFAQFRMRQSETDIVVREGAVSDQDRVAQRALAQKMHLVFARSEIDRREILAW